MFVIVVLLLYCCIWATVVKCTRLQYFLSVLQLSMQPTQGYFSAKGYVLYQDFTISILYIYAYYVSVFIYKFSKI